MLERSLSPGSALQDLVHEDASLDAQRKRGWNGQLSLPSGAFVLAVGLWVRSWELEDGRSYKSCAAVFVPLGLIVVLPNS